jgi:hypothetical protein
VGCQGGGVEFRVGGGKAVRTFARMPTSQNRDPSASSGQVMGHPILWRVSDLGQPPKQVAVFAANALAEVEIGALCEWIPFR